jgi:hypothetical protein
MLAVLWGRIWVGGGFHVSIPASKRVDSSSSVKHVEEAHAELRDSWVTQLLREVDPGPMSVLEWIRRPPKRRSPSTLITEVAELHRIRSLWRPRSERLDIPTPRLRAHAQRMMRRRPARLREISEPRRTLEIAALLSTLSSRQSDVVLQLTLPDEVALQLQRCRPARPNFARRQGA